MCGVLSTGCFESLFSDLLLLSLRVRLSVLCGRLRQFCGSWASKKETKKALNAAVAAYVTDPHTHFEMGECGKSLSYIEYVQLTSILRAEKCSLCRISGQSTRLCLALAITLCQLARSKSNEQTRIYNTSTEHISPSISYVMLCSPVNCSVKLHIARCT